MTFVNTGLKNGFLINEQSFPKLFKNGEQIKDFNAEIDFEGNITVQTTISTGEELKQKLDDFITKTIKTLKNYLK